MEPEELKIRIPESALSFTASRSSGPGGQNVNKVNTRVELRFNVAESSYLTEREKEMVHTSLKKRINSEGEIIIVCQSERTQLTNKKKVVEKFYELIAKAVTEKPFRRAGSPTRASISGRLEKKRIKSKIKNLRRISGISGEDE